MQLTFDQIRGITVGAVDFEETESYLQPYRFTKAQREFTSYAARYYNRGMAAAGLLSATLPTTTRTSVCKSEHS